MPGIQDFTYANLGKETVRGTPVAPTRKFYAEGTGVIGPDYGLSFHDAENRGVRTRIARATSQYEDVILKLASADGIGYDDLSALALSPLKGALTGVGAGADKTWTCVPSMTAANAPESYTWDVGDDTQNFRVQYAMAKSFTLSAAKGELTNLSTELFGQRTTKVAKATPADNSAVKIPGDLWTIKQANTLAGLPGASIIANFLLDWKLEVTTGLLWRHYMDGNPYGAQHVETSIAAKLTMTVESTAQAVSEFYDKAIAGTLSFLRLKATGPALGGSNYSAQIDLPVLYDVPTIIDKDDNGVNLWTATANLTYDPTSSQSIGLVVVNSLSALP